MSSTTTPSSPATQSVDDGSAPDELRHGLLPTQVSRPVAWTMIIIFVAILFGLPIAQSIVEWRRGQTPGVLALTQLNHIPTRSDLRQFEDSLSEQSIAIRHAQPAVQQWLTRFGGAGKQGDRRGQRRLALLPPRDRLHHRPGLPRTRKSPPPRPQPPRCRGRRRNNLPRPAPGHPPVQAAARIPRHPPDPLRPDPASPILLLGDSFTNIYSAKQMGFGQSAGLAERLCFHLRHRIDWLARNDAGAHATRQMLQAQQQQRRDRLAGKRIVIWQFAVRELSLGDWQLLTGETQESH